MKVDPSFNCFQSVRVREYLILKLTCELKIKGQCEERYRVQAHAALHQPHSNQDGQDWTLEEEEVVGIKILTSEWFALVPHFESYFQAYPTCQVLVMCQVLCAR